jgi:hypothetical protein
MIYQIYLDFDGVLAACQERVEELAETEVTQTTFWKYANFPGFFQTLDPKPDFKTLLLGCYALASTSPFVKDTLRGLTATGRNFAQVGVEKKVWAGKHLTPYVLPEDVILVEKGVDKKVYATPFSILIDDTQKVIDAWVAAGGIGILHTDAKSTLEILEGVING